MESIKGKKTLKVLTLTQAMSGRLLQEELERREYEDEWPRATLFEKTLHSDMLNEHFLEKASFIRKNIYKTMPVNIAQVFEAYIIRNQYDAIVSWAENLGLPFAALMKITGVRKPHIGIFSWISKSKKGIMLKLVHSHFDRIVLMSSAQREYALTTLNIPEKKIAFLRWPVDLKFWRPLNNIHTNTISSVGREMRDYETLILALTDSGLQCHIAAGGVSNNDKHDRWMRYVGDSAILPSNITLGKKNYTELRQLYSTSKFIVIPILPTETDNGTTSILEAMAMGKAVICSKANGQRDVIQDGKTGIYVPLRDPRALREAMEYLSAHPEVADRMGTEGRKYVEQYHSLETFVVRIREIVEDAVCNGQ